MSAVQYKAVKGSRFSDKDAAEIGPILTELAGDGIVNAETVLSVASNPSSPLHRFFEWDDAKAAEAHRLSQARYMLRSITVEIEQSEEARPPRLMGVVVLDDERGYATLPTIVQNVDLMAQLLEQAKRDLNAWRAKYAQLRRIAGMSDVFAAIDAVNILKAAQ